jgi:hypothetical protein
MSEKETVEGYPDEPEELEDQTINLDKDDVIGTTVLIPKDLLKQLGYIAVEEGVSRGEMIRRCVKEYLGSHNPKSKDEGYAEKVKKLRALTKKLDGKYEVTIEAEDLFPENVDKAIEALEEAIASKET